MLVEERSFDCLMVSRKLVDHLKLLHNIDPIQYHHQDLGHLNLILAGDGNLQSLTLLVNTGSSTYP